eukprot:5074170-Prorocentrum_lima.AAC.1
MHTSRPTRSRPGSAMSKVRRARRVQHASQQAPLGAYFAHPRYEQAAPNLRAPDPCEASPR